MALDQNTLSVVIKLQTKGVAQNASRAGKSFDNLRLNVISLNQALELLGRVQQGLAKAFDLTIAKASKLETGIAEITTLLDGSTNAGMQLTEDVLSLQDAYGTDQIELAKSFYNAISSGAVGASNVHRLLDASSKLAVGGITDLQNATSGLTSIMNSYEMEVGQASSISDTLFLGMKAGVTTIGELSRELGDVSGIAHQMKIPFNELVATIAGVTTAGQNTNKTVTAVRSAIIALANASDEMKYAFKQLGIESIESAIAQDGFANTIAKLIGTTDGSSKAITGLFGAIESLPAVTAIANDSIRDKIIKTLNRMNDAAKNAGQVTEEAFKKLANTTAFQMGLVEARIDSSITRISGLFNTALLPLLKQVADVLDEVVNFSKALSTIDMSDLAESIRNVSLALGGLFALLNGGAVAKALLSLGLVAGKFILIGAAVTGVVAGIDILVRNFEILSRAGELVFLKLRKIVQSFVLATEELNQKFYSLFNYTHPRTEKNIITLKNSLVDTGFAISETSEKLDELLENFDYGIAGQFSDVMKEAFKTSNESIDNIIKKLQKVKLPDVAPGLSKEQLDILKKLQTQNDDLQLSINNVGTSQVTQLNNIYSLEVKRLQIFKDELKAQGNLTKEIKEQIDLRRRLANEKLKLDMAEATKGPSLITPDQIDMISGAMGSGIAEGAGMLSSAMSGALGWVGAANIIADAVQALIDFVPQFIDKLSGIFNSLTDLPKELVRALTGLGDSTVNFIKNFLPNFIKSIPKLILNDIKTILIEIPQAFLELAESLPEIIVNDFIEKIPEIIELYIAGMLSKMPKFIAASIRLAINLWTRALPELIKIVITEVPQAIIDGIKIGLNEITKLLGFELFKGFDLPIDEQVQKLQESFTGLSDQLFSVLEIEASARGIDLADRIGKAISSNVIKASNLLGKAWQALVDAWRWIWNNILEPIIDGIEAVFHWVDDKIFQPILNGLRIVFDFLKDIWDGVLGAFNGAIGFLKKTWEDATSAIQGVFDFLKKTFDDASKALQSIFSFFRDIVDKLSNVKIGGTVGDWWEKGKDILGLAEGGMVPLYAASGKFVPRGTDTVPAMLTPGEFVVRREAVNALGMGAMNAINQAHLPQGNTIVHIDLTIQTTQPIDRALIKGKIVPVIRDELKRASLDGSFVISKRGIR